MALRIKSIDIERTQPPYVKPDGSPQDPYYIGGIVLEDGEATMRFKPSKAQCDILWERLEPFVLEWAKTLILGDS